MSFKEKLILVVFIIFVMIQICIVSPINENKRTAKRIDFVTKDIYGYISFLEATGKGGYTINIKNKKTQILEYRLSTNTFLKENFIQVGDSVSKPKNEILMIFYKLDKKVYKKCCEYEVHSLIL